MTTPSSAPIRRALFSVSDKTGLIELATRLAAAKIDLLSTGGTASLLRGAGLSVTDVADVTGFPEIMGGRVKTLHPKIHGGLLGVRENENHLSSMREHNIPEFDVLIVNLYPFAKVMSSKASYAELIENIDIGGPAMIRAGAKNHRYVSVLVDQEDYKNFISQLKENSG